MYESSLLRQIVPHFAAQVSRRAGLGMLAAGAALLTRTAPSEAAYGEAANIFGKAGNQAGARFSQATIRYYYETACINWCWEVARLQSADCADC